MVSLWPWRSPDNSPASFEKTLSGLSEKIAQSNGNLEIHRQRARRFKALWTLYTTFAYILYALIAVLVLGWEQWGPVEYTALSGSPVIIYTIRRTGAAFYQYRITKTQKYLDELQKQRDGTIEKLKEATKYNSTLQLLEKYGAEPPKSPLAQEDAEGMEGGNRPGNAKRKGPRFRASLPFPGGTTGMTPPPTANIPRAPFGGSLPPSPMRQDQNRPPIPLELGSTGPSRIQPPPNQEQEQQQPHDEPGFHPSAFSTPQHIEPRQPQWYDRILDVLLGEDETLPKNRLALICVHCRLVNGQAAPGTRTMEEVGRWRCVGCGGWNGENKKAATHDEGLRKAHHRSRSKSVPHAPSRPAVVVEPATPRDVDGAWNTVSREGSISNEVMDEGNLSADEGADWSSDAELEAVEKEQSNIKDEPTD
ncbi:hypothetical protein FQN49_003225 [Arthroderma sp. PD_2]|nr:hypothetical protein FQN49_003225 [Arthroderma sp. PD_2]